MKKILTLNNFLLLTIFCMPLYLIKVDIFNVPSNVLEILALISIILVLFYKKESLLDAFYDLPKVFITSCIIILVGVLFSIIFNDNYRAGFGILKSWFLIPVFFSFALYTKIGSSLNIEKIFKSIYFSVVTVGLIAIFYKLFAITTYDNRLTAFYLSPNYLAMYLSLGIFFGLYFLFKSYLQNKFSKQFIFYVFTLLVILIPLYYTYSYGAWLAILFSLIITFIIFVCHSRTRLKASINSGGNPGSLLASETFWIPHQVRDDKRIILSILFLVVFIGLLFISQLHNPKLSAVLNFSERSSFASRMMIWKSSLLMIQQHHIIGIGPGNFQTAYLSLQKYYPPYLEWAVPEPHNIFLAFWLQAGLLGLIGFSMLLFFIFKTLWQTIKDKKNAALAAPLLGFFIYTILHGLIDTTYWKNDLALVFWICAFLTLLIHHNLQKNTLK